MVNHIINAVVLPVDQVQEPKNQLIGSLALQPGNLHPLVRLPSMLNRRHSTDWTLILAILRLIAMIFNWLICKIMPMIVAYKLQTCRLFHGAIDGIMPIWF